MNSHQKVLQAIGVADLDTLVDPGFLAQLGLNQPGQYGIVCADSRGNNKRSIKQKKRGSQKLATPSIKRYAYRNKLKPV